MPVNPTGGELHINSTTARDQTTASIEQGTEQQRRSIQAVAMDADGGFVVVWASQGQDVPISLAGWGVYAQRYDKDGNPAGSEFLVNTTVAGSQRSPAVAMDAAGNFAVTWTNSLISSPEDSGLGVFARRFNKDGTAVGSEFLVNTTTDNTQQNSSIAMNATGGFVVTWSSFGQDGGGWGVYAQQYNVDGSKKGGEIAVNSRVAGDTASPAVVGDQQSSSVAIAPDGSFVVTWESNGQDGSEWGIYARRFNAAGEPQGNEFQVNTTSTRSQRNPSVAIDANGNFFITWTGDDAIGRDVYFRRFKADGTDPTDGGAVGEVRVNIDTFQAQEFSTITTIPPSANLPSGGFAITWTSDSGEASGGSGSGVFLKRYNALGVQLEAELPVNTYTASNQAFSSVASDKNGNLAVIWTSADQPDALSVVDAVGGIYGQRYSASATLNVAPTDLAIAPNSLNENLGVNAVVGTFVTTDSNAGDSFTYTLVAGPGDTDNAAFSISSSQLLLNASADRETQETYSIRVRTTDAGELFAEKPLIITINNVNEAPTDISFSTDSIDENIPANSSIGTLQAIDPDRDDTFTYTLVDGTNDSALFEIVGNSLQIKESPNFETKSSYVVRIRATDLLGLTVEKDISIGVRNVTENPTDIQLTPSVINENQPANTPIGTFSSVDPEGNTGTFTYTLVAGNGDTNNDLFTISGAQLLVNAPFDFETKATYSVRVRTNDSTGLSFEKQVAIGVANLNEAPTAIALAPNTVDENAPSNTRVGSLTTTDPDSGDTHSYTLVAGAGDEDNAVFTLSPSGELRTNAPLDFEAKSTYNIRVRTTDLNGTGLSSEFSLTVTVNDLTEAPDNQAPTDLNLAPDAEIAENSGNNAIVGAFETIDPNAGDSFTYTLIDNLDPIANPTDNAAFVIEGSNLRILSSPNFEAKSTYNIRVRTRDVGGLSFDKNLTVTVTDVNEAPVDLNLSSLSVAENVPAASTVGTFSTTDPDAGNTFTYALVAGTGDTDNAAFTIVENNGISELRINASPNFEVKNAYQVLVRSTDQGGLSVEKALTIGVQDLNEAPTALALAPDSVNENVIAGTSVGNLQATDEDANETFTYRLVTGDGDTDNGKFTLTPEGQLIINVSPNYETTQKYTVRVQVTDRGGAGLTFVAPVEVKVNDIFEDGTPTNLAISNSDVSENNPPNTAVGQLTTTDPDSTNFTYTLVAGFGDNDAFSIAGDQLILNNPADRETKPSYQVKVRTTDDTLLSFEKTLTINVLNVNEAPTQLNLSNTVLDENAVNPVVGLLSTIDPDLNDTFTYSLDVGGDNSAFTIVGNELRLNTPPNFETKPSYNIRITTQDEQGLRLAKDFTITINNLLEAPTNLALSATAVDENKPIGTVVGSFTTTDQDIGDTHTYSLVTGDGDANNASFEIVNSELRLKVIPNFEAQPAYSIRVRTTDSTGRFFDKPFIIQVGNLGETPGSTPPQDLALSKTDVDENKPVDTIVGRLTTTDPDSNEAFTYTLVGTDNDNAAFTIVNDELRLNVVPNFEAKQTYSILIRTSDKGNQFIDKAFTIQVNDLPERPGDTAPSDLLLSSAIVNENVPANTAIGRLSTIDPDIGDSFIYTLVPGFGDNSSFRIVGDELQIITPPNFEAKPSYSIQVTTADLGGKSLTKTLTIAVQDVNEAPIITASTDALIYTEGSTAIRVDAAIAVADPDSSNLTGATLTLVGYVAGQDSLSFTNSGAIQGSFNAESGILELRGAATVADYQTALRSITYTNSSDSPITTNRTVRFTTTDGANTSNIATRTIQIVSTNTAPTIATSAGGLSYTESSGAVTIDAGVIVNDVDSADLRGATIEIGSYVAQQDVLSFAGLSGITSSFDAATGVLTLSGVAPLRTYQAALQLVKYTNLSSSPDLRDRTIRFNVTDGAATSNTATRVIQLVGTNTAPILTASNTLSSYTENSSPILVDGSLLISDPDSEILEGATVTLLGATSQEVLGFSNQKGIAGGFDPATGILTLTGRASVADYQTALQSITYLNTSDNPSASNRIVRFTVTDGTATSSPVTRTIQVIPVNDAPIAITSVKTLSFSRTAGAVTLDPNLTLSDVDSPTLAGATVILGGYVAGEDGLIFNDQEGITSSLNAATGTLSLTGVATVDSYRRALRSLIYTNSSDSSIISPRNLEITVTDSAANSDPATARLQIQFDKSDTVPVLDLNGSGVGRDFSNTFVVTGAPVAVADSTAWLTDSDSSFLTSAQVIVSNLLDGKNEELLVDTIGTGIRAFYDSVKGSLSLTGAASPATYLAVLRSIRYQNRSPAPNRATRIMLFSVNDETNSSEPAQTAVQITQINLSAGAIAPDRSFTTTPATDLITAPASNDAVTSTLANLQQNDQIDAGSGFDTLLLTDGEGTALVDVRNSINQVRGILTGRTTVTNFEYFDLSGFTGNVTLLGSDALNDRLTAGQGDDLLSGGGSSDRLLGNAGNDRLEGGAGDDVMEGGSGNDVYLVDSLKDVVLESLESGFDTVYSAVSWTMGEETEDLILTGQASIGTGNALINRLTGSESSNTLSGNAGNDWLIGNGGADLLVGGNGGDTLFGGKSNDKLSGGKGNDRLTGDEGKDELSGGQGKDRFCFTRSQKSSLDKIMDFRAADDTLCISRKGFSQSLKRGRVAATQFVLGSQAQDEGDRFIYSSTGALFFDRDGAGGTAQVQIAQLRNRAPLTRADILVIR